MENSDFLEIDILKAEDFLIYIFLTTETGVAGYIYIAIGLVLDAFLVFLLYKNTINIHDAVVDTKSGILSDIGKDIEKMNENSSIELPKKYEAIMSMISFSESVDSMSDWPFKAKSIRTLTLTLGSAIVPLLLSFFGL